jgi:3-oxoacyl-(acyl-carrier-protein) synthase III
MEQIVDTSDEWIRTRSGICARHIAEPEMALSDLLLPAAQAALADVHLAAADVDLIVVASVTGDMPLPSTACLLQHRLGATHAAAFDIAAACTGFIYGLSVASSMVSTGQYRNALVLGGDLLSRITDNTDRGTCVLLGDGGGAAVLQPVPDGRGILSSYLRADGSGGDLLTIPAGGSRRPTSMETVAQREHYLRMNGNVFTNLPCVRWRRPSVRYWNASVQACMMLPWSSRIKPTCGLSRPQQSGLVFPLTAGSLIYRSMGIRVPDQSPWPLTRRWNKSAYTRAI